MRDWIDEFHELGELFPMSIFEAAVVGVWDFAWEKGSFPIELRPGGVFYCEQYKAHAHWTLTGDQIEIRWGQYGQYVLTVGADGKSMVGSPSVALQVPAPAAAAPV